MNNDEILILGALPNSCGIGGVTIHIERLCKSLEARNYSFIVYDYKVHNIFAILYKIVTHTIIHVHASNPILRILHVSIAKLLGKKVVFTVHGNLGRFSTLKNQLDKLAVIFCDIPVLINQQSFDKAIQWNKRSQILSAFIPPQEKGFLPHEIIKKINNAKVQKKIIVSSNASIRSFTNTGEEIYGINFLIDFFKKEKDYVLIVSDPSGQYTRRYKKELFENILFVTGVHSFYTLMQHSDIMIRNTATDGDSLSVREGLYLHKKVIATNRIDRPEGVILFNYNDADSLQDALQSSWEIPMFHEPNTVNSLVSIYNELKK